MIHSDFGEQMPKRPLGPDAPGSLTELLEVEERIKDFIRGTAGGTGPLTDAVRTGAQRTCDAVGAAPDLVQDAVSLVSVARLCRPYWQDQGYSEPKEQVPFQGGQCVGTRYSVTTKQVRPDGEVRFATISLGPPPNFRQLFGPIGGIVKRNGSLGFTYFDQSGTTQFLLGLAAENTTSQFSIASVTPLSGSDDCGDPPSEYIPGPSPPPNPGVDFQPDFDPVTGQPLFEIPDIYIDPITGPAPVPGPDSTGEDGGDGAGGGGNFPPTGPGVAGQPSDSGDGGEIEGEAPAGEVLLGLLVELLVIPPFARQVQNALVPAYIGSAYVSMGWAGQLDLDNSGQFARAIEYYIAPLNATHWRVTAAIGYNLRVTPYYTETILEV